ncbi:MAG: hypothetical protein ACTSRK_18625 [Promethearchaeota archaeon]
MGNAQTFHAKATKMYTDEDFLKDPLSFIALDPSIMEGRNFKVLGGLVTSDQSRYGKIYPFSQRQDTVLKLLKRSNADSTEKLISGTAITNLTRMDFPEKYGELALERLIMQPGGGYPLTSINLVVGVVTCANQMSIIL